MAAEDFEGALARLVAELESLDDRRARAAAAPLIALPKTQPERARVAAALTPLIERLPPPDYDASLSLEFAQEEAVQVLSTLGAEAQPTLILAMSLESPTAYRNASAALAALGPVAIPPVLSRLREVGWKKMASVDLFFQGLGKPALPAMKEALQGDASEDVRFVVAESLAHFGEAQAAPLLIDALHNDSAPSVRAAAAGALASHCDTWRSSGPAIVEALEREVDPEAHARIAEKIAWMSAKEAEPAIPVLGASYRSASSEEQAEPYALALASVGSSWRMEKKQVRWWTLPQVYLGPMLLGAVFLLGWLLLAPRVGRYGLSGGVLAAKTLVIALVPAALSGGGAYYVLTRPWAKPFWLPLDRDLLLTPEVIASALAMILGIAGWLAARWRPHVPAPPALEAEEQATPEP